MKKDFKYLLICLTIFLIGCSSFKLLEQPKEKMPTSRLYNLGFDAVWESVLRNIIEYKD